MLHQYTIDEAIADKNVLGFHVDYINTGEFKSYDDLRERIIAEIKQEQPNVAEREIERLVFGWSELEVEEQAKQRGILVYHDETHIPRVVEEILNNWESQSQGREFNAILTVAYKKRVIAYYKEFKKQLKESGVTLNVAMTFSFGNEDDSEPLDPLVVEEMFRDYATFTGIEFVAGDKKHGEDAYFEDVVERATRGGSGRNPKNIDLIIVADQLLTGYDSKLLNTLYVDRSLELQGLIQAYSRTNRVYGSNKEFGSIINFQYPRITEETVNQALKLYGSGGKSSKAIVEPYATAVEKLAIRINEMVSTLSDPTRWQTIEHDEERKEAFILAFKDAAGQMNLVEQYYEYKWDDYAFGIDEHTWLRYVGAYKNITWEPGSPTPPTPTNTLVGKTKLAGTQVIDASHILNLIGSKTTSSNGKQTVDTETLRIIYQQIEELSNMGEHEQAQLLKEFVSEELEPGNVSSEMNFDEAFEIWKSDKMRKVIYKVSNEWGLDSAVFEKSVEAYSSSSPNEIPFIDDLMSSLDFESATNKAINQLQHSLRLTSYLTEVIPKIKSKYR